MTVHNKAPITLGGSSAFVGSLSSLKDNKLPTGDTNSGSAISDSGRTSVVLPGPYNITSTGPGLPPVPNQIRTPEEALLDEAQELLQQVQSAEHYRDLGISDELPLSLDRLRDENLATVKSEKVEDALDEVVLAVAEYIIAEQQELVREITEEETVHPNDADADTQWAWVHGGGKAEMQSMARRWHGLAQSESKHAGQAKKALQTMRELTATQCEIAWEKSDQVKTSLAQEERIDCFAFDPNTITAKNISELLTKAEQALEQNDGAFAQRLADEMVYVLENVRPPLLLSFMSEKRRNEALDEHRAKYKPRGLMPDQVKALKSEAWTIMQKAKPQAMVQRAHLTAKWVEKQPTMLRRLESMMKTASDMEGTAWQQAHQAISRLYQEVPRTD